MHIARLQSRLKLHLLYYLLVASYSYNLAAVDYEKLAPNTPAPNVGKIVEKSTPAKPVEEGDVLVVKVLRGLVFISSQSSLKKTGVEQKGIVINGPSLLDSDEFKMLISKYLGKPITINDLNNIEKETVIYYGEHDRPVVEVIAPEQDVTTGTIQLLVIESTLGEIKVQGNRWVSSVFLRDQVRLNPKDKFSEDRLQGDLRWLNNNPFRDVNIIFSPGDKTGTTDLILQTKDRFPLRIFAGYSNDGNYLTGEDRYFTGLNWGDAFFLDHQLNYQFTTDNSGKRFSSHTGSYIIPLPWRHTLTFFGGYAESKASIGDPFTLEGTSWQASTRYEIPLPEIEEYRHGLQLGFDFKKSNNDLEFGGDVVSNTPTEVLQFVAGYSGTMQDEWGQTSGSITCYVSPGGLTKNNQTQNFQVYQAFAKDKYMYGDIDISRITRLPFDFTLSNKFKYQFSNGNLLPSEQLGLGGQETIRGYEERIVNGSGGYFVSTEIRTPPISIFGSLLEMKDISDQLQFLCFWDYGVVGNHILLAGEDAHQQLSSVGPGLRFTVNQYVSVQFDYGFQLYSAVGSHEHSRGDLKIILSY